MIYILVKKFNESYDSLPDEYRFIFDEVERFPTDIQFYQRTLETYLNNADEEFDKFVFNGPAWLIALAGYHWFSNTERKRFNVLQFNTHRCRYEEIQGEFDDY